MFLGRRRHPRPGPRPVARRLDRRGQPALLRQDVHRAL